MVAVDVPRHNGTSGRTVLRLGEGRVVCHNTDPHGMFPRQIQHLTIILYRTVIVVYCGSRTG